MSRVKAIASIDLKKDEQALVQLAGKYQIPFVTYTAEELKQVGEVTSRSEFVEKTTGVDNVCERAALLCGENGKLIQGKQTGRIYDRSPCEVPGRAELLNEISTRSAERKNQSRVVSKDPALYMRLLKMYIGFVHVIF